MKKRILNILKNIKEFVKRNPLASLIIAALIIFLVNVIIATLTREPEVDNQTAQDTIDTSKAQGTNIKPSDFPENFGFLKQLPEINEYFTAEYLPLSRDEQVVVKVDLYQSDSRQQFEDWVSNFTGTANIQFIFNSTPSELQNSFEIRKTKYGQLLQLMPYDSEEFSIRAEEPENKGVKFRLFYDSSSTSALINAYAFLERFNLYKESLNLIEVAPFREPMDSIGE